MNVIKGTYRISLYDFIHQYTKNISNLEYTEAEAHDCIEFLKNGVLQYLKIYVINGKLYSCSKLISIARDFMDNKISDRTGRYFNEYDENDRFYLAHCVNFDYMECISNDNAKIERLVELIGAE